ncbi:hypothetical protein LH47_02015 [Anoxybacillus thermarum]|uniref:Uncharacterized protein n=1 Tax=Anoxybacillus thermarum TaxID=404937 RepID=A0A0D0RX35_9BACL|nr:hypothetical protein [Anoxybacillus thermarum]KIQ93865.1 hypothetical protein LH47_02015 [Anoxybacillus thermarum]
MEHDLKALRHYYDRVLINEYYSTPEIDPDITNKIVAGLILYMDIAEKQQAKIEKYEKALKEAIQAVWDAKRFKQEFNDMVGFDFFED